MLDNPKKTEPDDGVAHVTKTTRLRRAKKDADRDHSFAAALRPLVLCVRRAAALSPSGQALFDHLAAPA